MHPARTLFVTHGNPKSQTKEKITMKLLAYALVSLALCGPIHAQQHTMHNPPPAKKAVLMTGLGDLHHPVSTTNTEAQKFFDQGLRLIFAFNHEEALASFPARRRTRSQTGYGLLGHGGSDRTKLQRSRRS